VFLKGKISGWGCSSVVESLPRVNRAVGLIPSTIKQTKQANKITMGNHSTTFQIFTKISVPCIFTDLIVKSALKKITRNLFYQ
jgi:hypothetical protein